MYAPRDIFSIDSLRAHRLREWGSYLPAKPPSEPRFVTCTTLIPSRSWQDCARHGTPYESANHLLMRRQGP